MKVVLYELKDLKSGQYARGTAGVLSKLLGIKKDRISYFARENIDYEARYRIRKLQKEEIEKEKMKKIKKDIFCKQWDEICQIYNELRTGKRNIKRAADGKLYAIKIRKSV